MSSWLGFDGRSCFAKSPYLVGLGVFLSNYDFGKSANFIDMYSY